MVGKRVGVGIDIGKYALKIVALERRGDKLVIKKVLNVPLELSPEASPEERAEKTFELLRKVADIPEAKRGSVAIAVPGQFVFTRYIKLPPVKGAKLEQIVYFEAQQQVPFPLGEMAWDFHQLPSKVPGETNIVLAAIRTNVADEAVRQFLPLKISPDFVDSGAIASYNCVRKASSISEEQSVIFMEIGASGTDLSIEKEGLLCWTTSIPIGGFHITQAIAEALGVPFQEAEKIKCQKGKVLADGVEAEAESKSISDAVKGVLEDMLFEVQRSIGYFRSQLRGRVIHKIILSGGGAKLAGLADYMQARLGIEVEIAQPLSFAINGAEAEKSDPSMAVAVGLALHALGEDKIVDINLLPPVLVAKKEFARKSRYAIATYALILGGMLIFRGMISDSMVQQEKELAEAKARVTQYKLYAKSVDSIQAELNQIRQKIKDISELAEKRDFWMQTLLEITKMMPPEVRIKSIKSSGIEKLAHTGSSIPVKKYERFTMPASRPPRTKLRTNVQEEEEGYFLEIEGIAPSVTVANDFQRRLSESPIFSKVDYMEAPVAIRVSEGEVREREGGFIPPSRAKRGVATAQPEQAYLFHLKAIFRKGDTH